MEKFYFVVSENGLNRLKPEYSSEDAATDAAIGEVAKHSATAYVLCAIKVVERGVTPVSVTPLEDPE